MEEGIQRERAEKAAEAAEAKRLAVRVAADDTLSQATKDLIKDAADKAGELSQTPTATTGILSEVTDARAAAEAADEALGKRKLGFNINQNGVSLKSAILPIPEGEYLIIPAKIKVSKEAETGTTEWLEVKVGEDREILTINIVK